VNDLTAVPQRENDEARFITGVLLPMDGGQSARIG
jgi:hypothetical protein